MQVVGPEFFVGHVGVQWSAFNMMSREGSTRSFVTGIFVGQLGGKEKVAIELQM